MLSVLPPLWPMVVALVGVPVAVVAHELTHAIVAWPVAEQVAIDWRGLDTCVEYRDGWEPARWLVAGAPLLVGLAVLSVAPGVVRRGDAGTTALAVALLGVYALAGGLREYRLPQRSSTDSI